MTKFKDMTGQRFTRLLVISRAPSDSNGNARWNCVCDCGAQTISSGFTLRNGDAKSCGCLTTEQLAQRATHHGMYGTSEYRSWADMIQRCTNPRTNRYERYGGRGIKVCESWLNSFDQFYADMGPKPTPEHTIERDNVDGHYEPSNCRWVTRKEQSHNTSQTVRVLYNGEEMSLSQAIERSGSKNAFATVRQRLNKGWALEPALYYNYQENVGRASDLRGKRFDRFLVIERVESQTNKAKWLCRCDCGTERIVYASNLVYGRSRSCGCISKELLQTPGRISRKRKNKATNDQRQPSEK